VTAKTLFRLRRRLRLSQAGLAALLGCTGNTVARMERGEMRISEPMSRLLLLVAYLAERGDDYAAELAKRRRRPTKRAPGPRPPTPEAQLTPQPGTSERPDLTTILARRARRGIPT
jgi:transcriptional regulator with XRE-family HTH domain